MAPKLKQFPSLQNTVERSAGIEGIMQTATRDVSGDFV